MHVPILFLSILTNIIVCRDFYVGMFKRNDILVAQDRLYKERVFHGRVIAKYGRLFKCPITYIRIVDRLGMGKGPTVEILRGGLQKNFVVLRLYSLYTYPISVNIYVGCENKMVREKPTVVTTTVSEVTAKREDETTAVTNATNRDVSKDALKDVPKNVPKDVPKDVPKNDTPVSEEEKSNDSNLSDDNNKSGNKTE